MLRGWGVTFAFILHCSMYGTLVDIVCNTLVALVPTKGRVSKWLEREKKYLLLQ